jgi:urease accessory protein
MLRIVLTLTGLLVAGAAQAHTGHDHGAGFISGLLHPLTGADHLLAMVAVGLWASQLGGRALILVPAAFVAVMAVAGGFGVAGFIPPGFEAAILASLVVLGGAVALALRLHTVAAMVVVGVFAAAHGVAHGAELPEAAGATGYMLGFVAATGLLHGLGIVTGLLSARRFSGRATRLAGAAVALSGLALAAF